MVLGIVKFTISTFFLRLFRKKTLSIVFKYKKTKIRLIILHTFQIIIKKKNIYEQIQTLDIHSNTFTNTLAHR